MKRLSDEVEMSYVDLCRGLLLLLRAEDEMAKFAASCMRDRRKLIEEEVEKDRLDEATREESMRRKLEEEALALAERDAIKRAWIVEAIRKEERHLCAREEAIREANIKSLTSVVHIHRAINLVNGVMDVWSVLIPFETSTNVSKRRLQFKKVVNGKINMLLRDSAMPLPRSASRLLQLANACKKSSYYRMPPSVRLARADPPLVSAGGSCSHAMAGDVHPK